MSDAATVVIIDADHAFLNLMQEFLCDEGYAPLCWKGFHGAHDFVRRSHPEVIILDTWLESSIDGQRLFDQLQADPVTRAIPFILVTSDPGFHRHEVADLAAATLHKPFDLADLLVHVRKTIASSRHAMLNAACMSSTSTEFPGAK